jgi:peptidylprolyl isomerase
MSKVKTGDTVTVHYTGTLDNGDLFDSSKMDGREPFSFEIGSNSVIPGFEEGVIGMTVGESKTIAIPMENAYGPYDENLVMPAPMERLPEGTEVGTQLQLMTPQGPMVAKVTSISEDKQTAMIDHNHPLAGQQLTFELELMGITATETVE